MQILLQSYGQIRRQRDHSGRETCANLHNHVIIIDITTLSKNPGVHHPVIFNLSDKNNYNNSNNDPNF